MSDQFSGYAVIGLTFQSGHVLALRRFEASSVGPAYTSLWHRDPASRWTLYSTVPTEQGCARYFGSAMATEIRTAIRLEWISAHFLRVAIGGERPVWWELQIQATLATRVMNASANRMPQSWWHNRAILQAMGSLAGIALGAGTMNLTGRTPNGHEFVANPRRVWMVESSRAIVEGVDLGPVGPLAQQARLEDFWIPQRGVFAIVESQLKQPEAPAAQPILSQ